MNDSHNRTHYRTVYASTNKRFDTGTIVGLVLVLLALVAFFMFLMFMQ